MGPALLPAGAMLSMLRWSLSFTAQIREGGVSCRKFVYHRKGCFLPEVVSHKQSRGWSGCRPRGCWSTAVCGTGKLQFCLQDTSAMPPQVVLEMRPVAAVESVTLDEVCGAVRKGGESRMRDCLDNCRQGHD